MVWQVTAALPVHSHVDKYLCYVTVTGIIPSIRVNNKLAKGHLQYANETKKT